MEFFSLGVSGKTRLIHSIYIALNVELVLMIVRALVVLTPRKAASYNQMPNRIAFNDLKAYYHRNGPEWQESFDLPN